jgi:hypothetical protein
MADMDYGYGDASDMGYGYGDAPDMGYGDAAPDMGYGDAVDMGYGDAADMGYGDAGDMGYGDAEPDDPNKAVEPAAVEKRRPKRRCSVTKFSIEEDSPMHAASMINDFRAGLLASQTAAAAPAAAPVPEPTPEPEVISDTEVMAIEKQRRSSRGTERTRSCVSDDGMDYDPNHPKNDKAQDGHRGGKREQKHGKRGIMGKMGKLRKRLSVAF